MLKRIVLWAWLLFPLVATRQPATDESPGRRVRKGRAGTLYTDGRPREQGRPSRPKRFKAALLLRGNTGSACRRHVAVNKCQKGGRGKRSRTCVKTDRLADSRGGPLAVDGMHGNHIKVF